MCCCEMLAGPARRHALLLLLSLALLAYVKGHSISGSQPEGGHGNTLSDDEDFAGIVSTTFTVTSTVGCNAWKDADISGISQKVINDMIVYVDEVCKCGFNVRSLSPVQAKCHNDTLLVSTDMTLPDNQQYSKFITYLENWLETDPHFTRNNGGITVYVNDLDAAPLAHSATSGSGEEESSGTTPTTDTVPITFFATSPHSCSMWKSADREFSAHLIINYMMEYVRKKCQCVYNKDYITPVQSMCDDNTILVSTNMTVPFDQESSQLISYLTNWITSEPYFKPSLSNIGTTTVYVVDFQSSYFVYSPSAETEDSNTMETTQVPEDEDEYGSGEDSFESSSECIAVNIATLLLAGIAVLIPSHLT